MGELVKRNKPVFHRNDVESTVDRLHDGHHMPPFYGRGPFLTRPIFVQIVVMSEIINLPSREPVQLFGHVHSPKIWNVFTT